VKSSATEHRARTQGTRAHFHDTGWSTVLAAGQSTSPQASAALEKLCRTCWYPLYACVRRKGRSPSDAQDLALCESEWVKLGAEPRAPASSPANRGDWPMGEGAPDVEPLPAFARTVRAPRLGPDQRTKGGHGGAQFPQPAPRAVAD
jgi:hypothetical protein